ncbi:MAG TPA: CBM20 domain-containing protein, partial [bacterium]|nr:CBM20 domain-containing protein [bacterium]
KNGKKKKKNKFFNRCKINCSICKECEKNIHKNYIEKIKEEKRKIKTESSEYQTYKIKVKNDKTKFGEQIYIVGSINELGNWDPKKSIGPMKCPNWPEWEIEIKLPPKRIIEFKFIVKDEKGNIKWESGNNRIINTSTQDNTNLEFIFNQ